MKEETAKKLIEIIQLQEEFGDEIYIADRVRNVLDRELRKNQGDINIEDFVTSLLIDLKTNPDRKRKLYIKDINSKNSVLQEYLINKWQEWKKRGGFTRKEFMEDSQKELRIGDHKLEQCMSAVDYFEKQNEFPAEKKTEKFRSLF